MSNYTPRPEDLPFHILVVCTGNICRSPVAEVMLRTLLSQHPAITVSSRGLSAPPLFPIHPWSVNAATRLGFVMSPEHKSQGLSIRDAQSAQLVLAMEQHQAQQLSARFPVLRGRIFLLGHWGEGEIMDPINHSQSKFDEVTEKLLNASKSWAQRLSMIDLSTLRS